MVAPLLPREALLARVGHMRTFLCDLVPQSSQFLAPRLERTECDDLGLLGIKQALVLPLAALAPRQPLSLLPLKPCEGLLFRGCPGLRPRRDHARIPEPRLQSVPAHGVEALRADERGGTLLRPADGPWRMACARLLEVGVFFPGAQGPDADHAEAARAAVAEGPEEISSCSWLGHLARGCAMPLQVLLGFVQQFGSAKRWGFAPNPCALWARAPPRLERPSLVVCGLTILGDNRLAIIVTYLPGIDTIGEEVAPGGHVPDVVLARGGGRGGGVQPCGQLPTTAWFFSHGARDSPHDVSRRGLQHPLGRAARPLRQIPVSITLRRPWHARPPPRCLQPAPPRPFGPLGALILRAHALPWRPPCARRTSAERLVEQDPRRVQLGALFDQEPLMRIVPGEPIGRHEPPGVTRPTPRRITPPVQGRTLQPRPAAAIIALFLLREQAPVLLLHVVGEPASLTLERAVVVLLMGRDARIVTNGVSLISNSQSTS